MVPRHDGRRVAPDGHEGAVADRDLARIAGEDVEAEHRDEEDPDLRRERDVVVAEDERQCDEYPRYGEHGDESGETTHTRRTSRWPKSPDGLMRRTTSRT